MDPDDLSIESLRSAIRGKRRTEDQDEAARVHDALGLITAIKFDLALVDLGLPDGSGVDVVAALRESQPEAQSVVVTIHDDDDHLFPALQAGAFGYLNPIIAAVLHNAGSLVVVFNSARLVRIGEELEPFQAALAQPADKGPGRQAEPAPQLAPKPA